MKVASDLHPCDLTGDQSLHLQTSRVPPSGNLLRGLSKPQLLVLQNPECDGSEPNQPNKSALFANIKANWKDIVHLHTKHYNEGALLFVFKIYSSLYLL